MSLFPAIPPGSRIKIERAGFIFNLPCGQVIVPDLKNSTEGILAGRISPAMEGVLGARVSMVPSDFKGLEPVLKVVQ